MIKDSPLVNVVDEGYSGHEGGPNGTITRIVIHGTVSEDYSGQALNTAHYFESANSGGLAHYVVDPTTIVQCCPESEWCWHAPPNPGSIGIELTDPVAGQATRWSDAQHAPQLRLAAALVADIAQRRHIPLNKIGPQDLQNGQWGICGHVDVSQAWHQSDHSDPGADFPWDFFMNEVRQASGQSQGGFMAGDADRVITALGQSRDQILAMLEGQTNPDGSLKDPTHASLKGLNMRVNDMESKLDRIIAHLGA